MIRRIASRLIAFGRIGPSFLAKFVRYSMYKDLLYNRYVLGDIAETSRFLVSHFRVSASRVSEMREVERDLGANGEKPITYEKINKK